MWIKILEWMLPLIKTIAPKLALKLYDYVVEKLENLVDKDNKE